MSEKTGVKAVSECPECCGFGSIGDGPFSVGTECSLCDGQGVINIPSGVS